MACAFLKRHGFFIKEKNYYTTVGEIDIVAEKGGDYYFIEVKTRREGELANDTAITYEKRRRILKTIKHYCYKRNISETGLILAGLIVTIPKTGKILKFRFAVFDS
jgi:putative endonuclease